MEYYDWFKMDDEYIADVRQASQDCYEYYMIGIDAKVGDEVYDDLTKEVHVITKVYSDGGFLIDSSWLGGARFPWELTNPMRYDGYIPPNIILGYD